MNKGGGYYQCVARERQDGFISMNKAAQKGLPVHQDILVV